MRVRGLTFCRAAALACMSLLSACAINPANQPDVSNGKDGLVYATSLNSKLWKDTVQIKSISTRETYDLRVDQRGRIETMHAWIPPGNYQLTSWDGAKFPAYEVIHVTGRHVTDLGTLLPVQVGEYRFVVLPLHEKDMAPVMATLRAKYPGALDDAQVDRWNPMAMPPLLTEPGQAGGGLVADLILAYARKLAKPPKNQSLTDSNSISQFLALAEAESPPTTNVGVADNAGNLYFGAALGTIRVRHPDGHWNAINTGVIHSVTAVAWNGHLLVAGYDDGSIRSSADLGAHWSYDTTLPSGDPVLSLNWTGQRWLAETFEGLVSIANTLSGQTVTIYLSKDSAPGNFSEIYKKISKRVMTVNVQLVGNDYYISMKQELARLDLHSMKWNDLRLPTWATDFHVAQDQHTMTLVRNGGIWSSVWISTNDGRRWTKTARPPIIIVDAKYFPGSTGCRNAALLG